MIFKAVKIAGYLEIENFAGEKKKYPIAPMDIDLMNELKELEGKEDANTVVEQFKLFCGDFDESDLKGIQSDTLAEMLNYVVETSSGKKRPEPEKKTQSKGHSRS